MSPILKSKSHTIKINSAVDGVGPEKVIWGSDCYFFGETHQLGKVVGARILDEEKILILSGNAKRILAKSKLKGTS